MLILRHIGTPSPKKMPPPLDILGYAPASYRRLRNIYSPTSRSNLWSMAAIVGLTDNTCVGYYD